MLPIPTFRKFLFRTRTLGYGRLSESGSALGPLWAIEPDRRLWPTRPISQLALPFAIAPSRV